MSEEVLTTVDVPERLYPGYVYVLMLEDDKLYVGYTKDAEVRISSHFLGRALVGQSCTDHSALRAFSPETLSWRTALLLP